MCAFMPKCHCFPFLARSISGSRSPARFLVKDGALMSQLVSFQEMPEIQDGGLVGQGP